VKPMVPNTTPEQIRMNDVEFWNHEVSFLLREMLFALKQAHNSKFDEEKREGYMQRADYLRERGLYCIDNAYNTTKDKHSTNKEEKI